MAAVGGGTTKWGMVMWRFAFATLVLWALGLHQAVLVPTTAHAQGFPGDLSGQAASAEGGRKATANKPKAKSLPSSEPASASDNREIEAAAALIKAKDHAGAMAALDKLLVRSPSSGTALFMRGSLFADLAEHDKAIADYDRAAKLLPAVAIVVAMRGQSQLKKGEIALAAADFDRAVKIDASNVQSRHARAQFFALRNDFDAALKDIDHVLLLRPNDPIALSWRSKWQADRQQFQQLKAAAAAPPVAATSPAAAPAAPAPATASGPPLAPVVRDAMAASDAQFMKADFKAALQTVETALAVNPDSEPLLYRRARAFYNVKDFAKAEPEIERLVARFPASADMVNLRGALRREQQKPELARADFERAVALQPTNAFAHVNLARIQIALGDRASALTSLTNAVRINPTIHALSLKIQLEAERSDFAAAEVDIAQAEQLGGAQSVDFLNARGFTKYLRGRPTEAFVDYTAALAIAPASLAALKGQAECHERLGRFPEALAAYTILAGRPEEDAVTKSYKTVARTAIARVEGYASASKVIDAASVSMKNRDFMAVVNDVSHEIEKSPSMAPLYVVRGRALLQLGKLEPALADFDKAIILMPRLESALTARALILAMTYRRYDNAQTDIDRVIAINPRNAEILVAQAIVFLGRGEALRALTAADSAIEYAPQNADAYSYRGMANLRLARTDKAVADFAKALALRPNLNDALYGRGLAHAKKGQHELAVADFSAAIDGYTRKFPGLYIERGKSLESLGQTEKAAADYQTARDFAATGPSDVAAQTEAAQRLSQIQKTGSSSNCANQKEQCL